MSVCSAMSIKHRTPSFPHLPPGEPGWASQARTQDPQVWSHELTPPSSSSTAHSPSNRNPPPSAASWCATPLPVPPQPSLPRTPPPPSPPPSLPCASQEGREVGSEVAEEGCGGGVVSSIGSAYPGTGGSCRTLPFPFAPFCGGRMKVVTRLCILHSTEERARAREREREREEREREREKRERQREQTSPLSLHSRQVSGALHLQSDGGARGNRGARGRGAWAFCVRARAQCREAKVSRM